MLLAYAIERRCCCDCTQGKPCYLNLHDTEADLTLCLRHLHNDTSLHVQVKCDTIG